MSVTFQRIAAASILVMTVASHASAAYFQAQRYDFDDPGNLVTQAGWTSILPTTAATGSSAGLILGDTHLLGAFTRVPFLGSPPSNPPADVLRDVLIGYGQAPGLPVGNPEPTIRFRDITPAGARRVTITVHVNDPRDGWQADFTSKYSRNDESFVVFDTGHGVNGFYHPSITLNLVLDERQTAGILDLAFFDDVSAGNTQVRLNGIEFVYEVPEPASATVLAGCSALLLRRRQY